MKRVHRPDDRQIHLPRKVRCQTAKIKAFMSLGGKTEKFLAGATLADGKDSNVTGIARVGPGGCGVTYQHDQILKSWFIQKTGSPCASLTAETLVNFGEHVDCGERISSRFKEVLIKAEVMAIEYARPDFMEYFKKDSIFVQMLDYFGCGWRSRTLFAEALAQYPTLRLTKFSARDLVHKVNVMRYLECR